MKPRSKKKASQAADQARRRPQEGPARASFTYYSGSRTTTTPRHSQDVRATKNSLVGDRLKLDSGGMATAMKHLATRLKKQWGVTLVGVILLVCVISLLQVDTKPRIIVLGDANQHSLHSSNEYAARVTSSLRSSLLNGNKITINTASIVQDLTTTFPEIYDASVVLPLVGHRPAVYIELAKPVIILQTANHAFVVDASGRALQSSADHTAFTSLALPSVVDQNNLELKVGDVVLSSATVTFVRDVIRQFKTQHTAIDRLVLPAGKEELDIYPSGVTYFVKFNLHATNSRQQAGTYFAAAQELIRKGKGTKKNLPDEYFDVRLPGRVYYK